MRLTVTAEFTLPEGIEFGLLRASSCLVSGAGVFFAVAGCDGGARYALVSIADGVVRSVVPDELGAPLT